MFRHCYHRTRSQLKINESSNRGGVASRRYEAIIVTRFVETFVGTVRREYISNVNQNESQGLNEMRILKCKDENSRA